MRYFSCPVPYGDTGVGRRSSGQSVCSWLCVYVVKGMFVWMDKMDPGHNDFIMTSWYRG